MAYTGTEIFDRAIAILDELSDTGTVLDSQVSEYKYRAPYLLDVWQHENTELQETATILRKPETNLLGARFDVQAHSTGDITYESRTTAKAAVFTVNDQAEVFIENYVSGAWVNAAGYYSQDEGEETGFDGVISVPALTTPSSFKCRVTPQGDKTRIRFSGEYYYLFSNFALFEAAFSSCGKVPEYGEYVRYDLPDNFDTISQILTESPSAGLTHRWENGDLMVGYDYEGEIKITYRPSPVKITDLSQTLEISDGAATAGAYYLAHHFFISDQNEDMANMCAGKYREIESKMSVKKPQAPTRIRDVYGISGIR